MLIHDVHCLQGTCCCRKTAVLQYKIVGFSRFVVNDKIELDVRACGVLVLMIDVFQCLLISHGPELPLHD